jgi:hypothetical protein
MAQEPAFAEGLWRVREEAQDKSVALVCAERDPIDCHRALLVGRALGGQGLPVTHLHFDGSAETHAELEERLLRKEELSDDDLLASRAERLTRAYRWRAARIGAGRA